MRFESLRDGIEDYMYLDMAKELIPEYMYDEIMDNVTVSAVEWTKDSELFYNTRVALGNMIESQIKTTGMNEASLGEFKANSDFTTGDTSYIGGAVPGTTVLTVISSVDNINGVIITRNGESLGLTDTIMPGDVMEIINGTQWTIIIKGSVNGDDKINLADVSAMLQKIAGWDVNADSMAGDVDANGKLNLSDVSTVLKKIAGWDVEFDMRPVIAASAD